MRDWQRAMKDYLGWAAAILLLFASVHYLHAQFSPDLARIKLAAERGDAQAQSQMGDAYQASFEFSEAAKWYRTAAEKGVAHCQHRLGEMLLTGRPAVKPGATKVLINTEEAVQWFFRAANQGLLESQIALGQCYRDGKGVKKDSVEAYKWFGIAARKDGIVAKVYRDQLVLKMSTGEIAEGDKRVADYKPNTSSPSPYASMLLLKGITGTREKRMAIINDRTFTAGEESNVKVGSKALKIQCVEVKERSAVVNLTETGERIEIILR